MFRSFFLSKKWWPWAVFGISATLFLSWFKVEIDVKINEWYGAFYDLVQHILDKPGSVKPAEFYAVALDFVYLGVTYVIVAVILSFILNHFTFRWRTALTDYYTSHWSKLHHVEGASQRIQEDTMRLSKVIQILMTEVANAVLLLIAFIPLLYEVGKPVTEVLVIGHWDNALVWVVVLFSLLGILVLAGIGHKLPQLEFNNKKVEASYRKELVLGEDNPEHAQPLTLGQLFQDVRQNYYRYYWHYMYFDMARYSYIQFSYVISYIVMAPTLVAGLLTLGAMQQIARAFYQVLTAFQALLQNWPSIVELLSIHRRLHAFEQFIKHPAADRSAVADQENQ